MLILLLACADKTDPAATDDTAAVDTTDTADDDTGTPPVDVNVSGLTLQEAGVCGIGGYQEAESGALTGVTGASPVGTGQLSGVSLGALVDSSVIVQTPANGLVDYGMDLDSETFDLYIPKAYDGSEPYGLIVHINAGNDGAIPSSWMSVLDEQRLIWIGGEDIGNSVGVDERMGLSVLGAHRALELFNIDRSRVFATGMSGGGRTTSVMAWHHPDLFPAAMPVCGAAYFREVEQAYETHEPDSHYEFWGSSYYPDVDGQSFSDWAAASGQRFALLTSFEDFREGDVMNIAHHGLEPDGFDARLLEGEGGHCVTSTEQALDAIAFLDHPLFPIIDDDFSDGLLITSATGSGFLDASAGGTAAESDGLQLSGSALAVARDRVHLDDAGGAIVRWTVAPTALSGGAFSAGLWAYEDSTVIDTLAGMGEAARPGVVVTLSEDGGTPVVTLTASGLSEKQEILLQATLSDWDGASALAMKLQVWSAEIQLDIGAHVAEVLTTGEGARLLDDARTIRVRLDERASTFAETSWTDGAVLALSTEGVDAAVSAVRIQDAVGSLCAE